MPGKVHLMPCPAGQHVGMGATAGGDAPKQHQREYNSTISDSLISAPN